MDATCATWNACLIAATQIDSASFAQVIRERERERCYRPRASIMTDDDAPVPTNWIFGDIRDNTSPDKWLLWLIASRVRFEKTFYCENVTE